jgi:hypothetical protein
MSSPPPAAATIALLKARPEIIWSHFAARASPVPPANGSQERIRWESQAERAYPVAYEYFISRAEGVILSWTACSLSGAKAGEISRRQFTLESDLPDSLFLCPNSPPRLGRFPRSTRAHELGSEFLAICRCPEARVFF